MILQVFYNSSISENRIMQALENDKNTEFHSENPVTNVNYFDLARYDTSGESGLDILKMEQPWRNGRVWDL